MALELPACSACGDVVPASRLIEASDTRVTACCPGCLTVEELTSHLTTKEWTSLRVIAPGAEVARERTRFAEELAAGTLSRSLMRDRQRFNRLSIPELFEVARPLFHRPARFHRAQGIALPSDALPDAPRRFLRHWRTPHVFAAGDTAPVIGIFGDLVMVAAPDGGTPFCVEKKEIDLGMPSTRLVIRGDHAPEANGRLAIVVDDVERETPVRVDALASLDPYTGGEVWTWSATLSDREDSLFLVHWTKKSNPGYDATERFVHGTTDGGRTWTAIAEERADAALEGAQLLHQLDSEGRY